MKIQFHLIWYWICFEFENDDYLNDIAEEHGYKKPNLKKISLTVWKRGNYHNTDEVNRKYRPKFQWPLKHKDYGDESLK